MVSYEAQFAIGERVIIDGDSSLVGTVTAAFFRGPAVLIEVSWVINGDAKSASIEEFRLQRKES